MDQTRIKFCSTFTSDHDLRLLVEQTLVEAGLILDNEDPDFVFASDDMQPEFAGDFYHLPAIILSSGAVYSCLDSSRRVVEEPFSEHDALVVPSSHACHKQIAYIQQEGWLRSRYPDNAVLRIFEVYGPGVPGTINSLLYSNTYAVEHSDQAKNVYLYVDDFKEVLLRFVKVFVEDKVRGIYNVAGKPTDIISIKNLIDLIHQTKYTSKDKPSITVNKGTQFVNMYCAADIDRISAVTGYTPVTSIRKGIFLACNSPASSSWTRT